jgi:hypothetical protein
MTARTGGRWGGVAILLLAAAGCFSTRDPVSPPGANCETFVRSTPGNVLSNYELAWNCGAEGAAVILDVLDDTFVLVLDPIDAGETGINSLNASQVELAQGVIVTAPADSFHFTFTRIPPFEDQGTAEYRDMPYSLEVFTRVSADSVRLSKLVTGFTTLQMAEDPISTLWSMTRWEDHGGGAGSGTVGRYYADNTVAGP